MKKRGKRLKEVKAEQAKKRRRAKRRKRILVLTIELLIFVTLLGIGYVLTKFGKIQTHIFTDGAIVINDGVTQEGYTTIALFGGDSREGALEAGTHADTMIIASIDNKTKEVKLVSVYRDLLTMQKDGEIRKANSAYFIGGPEDAINMLNRNFDLDIQDYVAVDFKALADAIDLLGGIELEVSEQEAAEMNRYIGETATIAGKEGNTVSAGKQKMDGVQAVTYARIRKNVGGDYARTDRQRIVIQKVVEKVKSTDLATVNDIIDKVFPQVSTSFTLKEILKLASAATQYKIGETSGFPFELTDGMVTGIGSVVIPFGVVENVEELHTFMYPKDTYEVSETVRSIAAEIEYISGYTRADYIDPNATGE